jgi:hypothetical protein
MPSAQYYVDQAKSLLDWAGATKDKAYAYLLRERANSLLDQANEAHPAVSDLNPLLAEFNDRQMRGSGPDEGAGG